MILFALPVAALALVSLATFLGRWVWWLDVFANFRAQYGVALAVGGLILLGGRRRWVAYAVLAVAAFNLAFVAPLYIGGPGDSDPAAPSIRILSHNLLSTNEDFADMVAYLHEVDADLVFLHESSRPWEVALAAAELDYEIIRPAAEELIFGTLILARDRVEVVSFGYALSQPRAAEVRYHPEGWPLPVSILTVHPLAPTDSERSSLRNAQLAFAADWAAGAGSPKIVVGDLNATPWSWAFRRLLDEGGLRNSQTGFGLQSSFPVTSISVLRVPIDHLLHDDALRIRDRRLGPEVGSDHFSLIVDLELAATG